MLITLIIEQTGDEKKTKQAMKSSEVHNSVDLDDQLDMNNNDFDFIDYNTGSQDAANSNSLKKETSYFKRMT